MDALAKAIEQHGPDTDILALRADHWISILASIYARSGGQEAFNDAKIAAGIEGTFTLGQADQLFPAPVDALAAAVVQYGADFAIDDLDAFSPDFSGIIAAIYARAGGSEKMHAAVDAAGLDGDALTLGQAAQLFPVEVR